MLMRPDVLARAIRRFLNHTNTISCQRVAEGGVLHVRGEAGEVVAEGEGGAASSCLDLEIGNDVDYMPLVV